MLNLSNKVVSVFVWDLDPMLDRVFEAELPQDVAS